MAPLRAMLFREYVTRLHHWRSELDRAARDGNAEKLAEARAYCLEYERMIAELTREEPSPHPSLSKPSATEGGDQIGAPPTLGGDGKPVLDS